MALGAVLLLLLALAGRGDALRSLGVGDGAAAQGDYAVDLNATSFDAFLTASREQFAVVEFFAHWCPACRNYKPHYEKVAKLFNGPDAAHPGRVLMARVDCASKVNVDLCSRFSVDHYPFLLWGPPPKFANTKWDRKQEKSEIKLIDDGRTAERLLKWINKQLESSFTLDDKKYENENMLPNNVSDPKQVVQAIYDVEEATAHALQIILEHKMIKPDTRDSLIRFLQILVAHHPSKRCRRGSAELLINFDDHWPSNLSLSSQDSSKLLESVAADNHKICGKEVPLYLHPSLPPPSPSSSLPEIHIRDALLDQFLGAVNLSPEAAMVSPDAIRTVIGVIGNGTALVLFLSPVPTFYRIWKKKTVEQYSAVPYLATLLNCMMWVLYGLPLVHPHSMLVITINGTGMVIELAYIALFLTYSVGAARRRVLILLVAEVAFVGGVAALVLSLAHTHDRRSMVVGILCVLFGTGMYAAPLSVMKMVIQTKSVEYMPLFLSVASLVNGICWTAYALIHFDLYITIPNGLGVMFAVGQIILYAIYYKSTQEILEARKRKADHVPMTEVVVDGKSGSAANGHY